MSSSSTGAPKIAPTIISLQNRLKPVVSASEASKVLISKITTRFATVREAYLFFSHGAAPNSILSSAQFRNALKRMGIDMTTHEFRKLWKEYDHDGNDHLSYAEFNSVIGNLIHPRTINVLQRPPTPPTASELARKRTIARKLKGKISDIRAAFAEMDTDGSKSISHGEFVRLLQRLGLKKITLDESVRIMEQYSKNKDSSKGLTLTLEEFEKFTTDYLHIPSSLDEEAYRPPTLIQAEKLLVEKLFGKFNAVQKAFRTFDEDKSGELSYDEVRLMFRHLQVPLTDSQCIALLQKWDPNEDGSITYNEFNKQIGTLIQPESFDKSLLADAFTRDDGGDKNSMIGDKAPKIVGSNNAEVMTFSDDEEEPIPETVPAPADASHGAGTGTKPLNSSSRSSVHGGRRSVQGSVASARSPGSVFSQDRRPSGQAPGGGLQRRPSSHSVSTSALDLNLTEEKMRRVLGRNWVRAYGDLKRSAAQSAGASGAMDPEAFRDSMAQAGVPLTSKEVRAIARSEFGTGNGAINADKFIQSTFKGPLPEGYAQQYNLTNNRRMEGSQPSTVSGFNTTAVRALAASGSSPFRSYNTNRPQSASNAMGVTNFNNSTGNNAGRTNNYGTTRRVGSAAHYRGMPVVATHSSLALRNESIF